MNDKEKPADNIETDQTIVDEQAPTNALTQRNGTNLPAMQHSGALSLPDNNVHMIAQIVANGGNAEAIDKIIEVINWDDKRKALSEFNEAFAKAKKKFKEAKKSGFNKNPNIMKPYSLLEDYDEASRDALSANGLAWRHNITTEVFTNPVNAQDEDKLTVTCILAHKGGHQETCAMSAPALSAVNKSTNELQSARIAVTYLRTTTLSSVLGLVSDSDVDTDGQTMDDSQSSYNQLAPAAAPKAKPMYPVESYDLNLPQWKALVESGKKTGQDIINTAQRKGNLTQAQRKEVLAFKPKTATEEPE